MNPMNTEEQTHLNLLQPRTSRNNEVEVLEPSQNLTNKGDPFTNNQIPSFIQKESMVEQN